MADYTTPQFSRRQVDKAGDTLIAPFGDLDSLIAFTQATKIINNWRSSHSYPLNSFAVDLRRRIAKIQIGTPLVAQRIKRLESIHSKLSRQTTKLSQMQDIGGCRGVLDDVSKVTELASRYLEGSSRFRHNLHGHKDYISDPKADGYRSFHLVYQYQGRGRFSAFDNLRIEIQLRSFIQHTWATAVESVGAFTEQALKSNQGDVDWQRFFALMGCHFADLEGSELVPGCPAEKASLVKEIRELSDKLQVLPLLDGFRTTIRYIGDWRKKDTAKYYLVSLDLKARRLNVRRYSAYQSAAANAQYMKLEKQTRKEPSTKVVLVSVDSIAALERAYPNYFLDTAQFASMLEDVVKNG